MTLANDLHWLVREGYVIEFNDGSLDLPAGESRLPAVPAEKTARAVGERACGRNCAKPSRGRLRAGKSCARSHPGPRFSRNKLHESAGRQAERRRQAELGRLEPGSSDDSERAGSA